MDQIRERLDLGLKRYGHGVRVNDDTREWGTKENSWMEMANEEILDCLIYVVADYIRQNRGKEEASVYEFDFFMHKDDSDDNEIILHILENYNRMEACRHKVLICALFNMV